MPKNYLLIFLSILLISFGITEFYITFKSFQMFQGLVLDGRYSSSYSPSFRWDWELFGRLMDGWILSVSIFISGILIFSRSNYVWSFCFASCSLQLIFALFTLYKYQWKMMEYSECHISWTEHFLTFKAIQITVAVLGLIFLSRPSVLSRLSHHLSTSRKWFASAIMALFMSIFIFAI